MWAGRSIRRNVASVLIAEGAPVVQEEPGEVGPVGPVEGLAVAQGRLAGAEHPAVGADDLEVEHVVRGGAVAGRAVEECAAGQAATDGRGPPREGAEPGEPQAAGRERGIDRFPGRADAHGQGHALGVQLHDAGQVPGVDDDGTFRVRHVAPGVGQAAAAGNHGMAGPGCRGHGSRQRGGVGGPDRGGAGGPLRVEIRAEQPALDRVGDDTVPANDGDERGNEVGAGRGFHGSPVRVAAQFTGTGPRAN